MFRLSKLVVSSLLTTLLTFPLTAKAQEHPLIGVDHPPLPEGVDEIGGWIIEDPYAVKQVSHYGQELLLLSHLIGRDNQGNAFFEVVNVLPLPSIAETEEIAGGDCFVNGKEEPNFIAIIKLEDDQPYLTKARKAWRVEGEKFNEVSVQGLRLKCENLSYGL